MIETDKIIFTIAIMAVVTYLCRMLPMVIFRKKISNVYVRSFLIYLPYGILAAMVFPAIFFSIFVTNEVGEKVLTVTTLIAVIIGTIVGVILSYKKKGLVLVAVTSTITVLCVDLLLGLFVKWAPWLNMALLIL